MPRRRPAPVAQAWIALHAEDPEAVSALAVARAHLPGARALAGLRRLRLFELRGALPERAALEELLHRSTRFYNPHKERCALRLAPSEPAPVDPAERAVLVFERAGERRPAAERWWKHETGDTLEVREGVAWLLRFEPGAEADPAALAVLRDRAHGLLCNPHAQEHRIAAAEIPLPWIVPQTRAVARGAP